MGKKLSITSTLSVIRKVFKNIPNTNSKNSISIDDILMSGLSLFNLKYPSLLKYDKQRQILSKTFKNVYGIEKLPSDTYMRARLDKIDPKYLRRCFTKLFALIQSAKYLEKFQHYQGNYLVSIDATGYFSSKKIHCNYCCEKNHRDGTKTYYHQILQSVLIHPDNKQVIPFAPEPIYKEDGSKKNDCERNAAKRVINDMRREHPHLDITILGDALYSNVPFINLLKEKNMHYILGIKPTDHKRLFDYVKIHSKQVQTYHYTCEQQHEHHFEFINDAPINKENEDKKVNFLSYTEISPKGKKKTFTWITDFKLTQHNVITIMRSGRSRWKIENETFNTLKNQGYEFEHNFGHGYQYLSHVFANLMLLAFAIDQIQEMGCKKFQLALKTMKRRSYLWERIKHLFHEFIIKSWESIYNYIANDINQSDNRSILPDTS